MTLSIVVPTLEEERALGSTLEAARRPDVELIVADGGSRDRTCEVARRLADRVLATARGRAAQMNAGAAEASGDVLLFLHADTILPVDYVAQIEAALADRAMVGGRFDLELDAVGAIYRLLEWLINLRSRATGVASGDQAIFVRRETFRHVGGYPPFPLMEDLALCAALKREGPLAALRARVRTSARRWQRDGVARTVLLMWGLRAAYYAGVPPARLARLYTATR